VVGELISLGEQRDRENQYQLRGRLNLLNHFVVGDHLNEFAIDQTTVSQSAGLRLAAEAQRTADRMPAG